MEKSKGHEGMGEKREVSGVFRKGWEACKGDEGYRELKVGFQKEQKEWDKAHKGSKEGGKKEMGVKEEKVVKDEEVKEEVTVKEASDQG